MYCLLIQADQMIRGDTTKQKPALLTALLEQEPKADQITLIMRLCVESQLQTYNRSILDA